MAMQRMTLHTEGGFLGGALSATLVRPDVKREQLAWHPSGQLAGHLDVGGLGQRFQYDAAGRLITLINENEAESLFAYDAMDRIAAPIIISHEADIGATSIKQRAHEAEKNVYSDPCIIGGHFINSPPNRHWILFYANRNTL
ncbi:MAG: hypothetical protein ACK4KV_15410 [Rhodocyclaceae bacterium]